MKKQIRQGVFETNSSSTHSVTIIEGSHFVPYYEKLNIETGEYGWEIETYTNIEDKLSYALTFALNRVDLDLFEMLHSVLEEWMPNTIINYEGLAYEEVENDFNNDCIETGYIDHGSYDEAASIFKSKDTLEDFIFGTDSYFETDNDNH